MRQPRWRSILVYIFTIGLIAAFAYYLYRNADKYASLLRVSPIEILLLVVFTLITMLVNGTVNTILFQSLGTTRLTSWDGFLLSAASTLANQLPVPGGIVTRGIYLKYRHDLSYTDYIAATLALFICTVSVNGFIGIGILLYWLIRDHTPPSALLLISFAIMAASIAMYSLPLSRLRIPKVNTEKVRQAMEGWTLLSRNPALLLKLLGLHIVIMLSLAARYAVAFQMLSQSIPMSQIILLSSASFLTQLVSFAPGGLGIREGIVAAVSAALGYDPGISVVAIGLDRLVSTVLIVLTGWAGTVILGKQISDGEELKKSHSSS